MGCAQAWQTFVVSGRIVVGHGVEAAVLVDGKAETDLARLSPNELSEVTGARRKTPIVIVRLVLAIPLVGDRVALNKK